MSNAVILGLSLNECDGTYPRTSDGRCHGCGTWAVSESEHQRLHRRSHRTAHPGKIRLHRPRKRRSLARTTLEMRCTDCGTELGPDVAWTDDPTAYSTPPNGYVSCDAVIRFKDGKRP